MRYTRKQDICGLEAGQLREFLRRNLQFDKQWFAQSLRLSSSAADRILAKLVSERYIGRTQHGGFELSDKAGGLIKAKFRLVSRKAATTAVEALQRRLLALSEQGFSWTVAEAYLFGSYVTSEDDPIGDVDVTVRLEMVHRFDESLQASADKKRMAIARAAGRRFSTDVDRFFWLQTEVTRYLKGRSPILDFTTFEDAAVTKALKTGACRKLAVSSALSNSPTSSYVSLDDITRHLQELGRDADRGDTMLSNDARNYLQIASECLRDSAADAAADTAQRSDFIELYLPAVFSKRYDAAFFERFRPVFREIATQVSRSPSKLLLPTTAHEIAFSLMIDYAKSAAQTDVTDSVFSSNMTLRRFGDLRDELDTYFEEICLDTDFEMLYDLPLARSLLQSKKACEDADIVSMDLAEWFEVFCGPNDVPYSIDGREQVLGHR